MLRDADRAYAEGIQKYKDVRLNQLIRDYRAGKVLDAEKFSDTLFDTQSTFRVTTVRQVVGEDAWRTVQAADTRNMLREARRLAPEGESKTAISGKALQSIFEERGNMLDAIYGKETAAKWRTYADMLAALDGKISPLALRRSSPDFSLALERSIAAKKQFDDFVKNDALRALKRGGPEEIDAAINVLTRPGQEAQLEHVIKFFGENSKETTLLRQGWLKKALSSAMERTTTGTSSRISGSAVDNFLSKYTKKEQELLAPNGLDADLRIVADQMKGLFPGADEPAAMGGALKAAHIKGHVPPIPPTVTRIRASIEWLEISFAGWLANRPMLIRAVADVARTPSIGNQIGSAAMKSLYRQFLMGGTQAISSTAETPPKAQ